MEINKIGVYSKYASGEVKFVEAFENVRWNYNKPENINHSYNGEYFNKDGQVVHWESFNIVVYEKIENKRLYWGVPTVNIRTQGNRQLMGSERTAIIDNTILFPLPLGYTAKDDLSVLVHCEADAPWLCDVHEKLYSREIL